MVSLGFGIGVVPQIVLDNSPLTARIRLYDIQPPLTAYDIGLFALHRRLKDPLIALALNWLEDKARHLGCAALTLDSGVQRHDAHRFYFREGMTILAYSFRKALK